MQQVDERLTGQIRRAVKLKYQIAVEHTAIGLGLLHGAGFGEQASLELPVEPQKQRGGGGRQHLLGGGRDHEGIGMHPLDVTLAGGLVGDGDAGPFRDRDGGGCADGSTQGGQQQGGAQQMGQEFHRVTSFTGRKQSESGPDNQKFSR